MRLSPALFVLVSALCAAPSALALNVRVLIAEAPSLIVNTAPGSANWQFGVSGGKLSLGGQDTGSDVLSLPPSAGGRVGVAGHTYRGGLIVRATKNGVQAINVVDIEEYLRGVVPAEMPPLWPQAAVRAQAIIARTYAAARINPAAPYDLCATTQCQVYQGVDKEHALSDAAISATRAQVVSSAGGLADTYFSADSGGYTASSQEAWGRAVPYLTAQPDPLSPSAQKPWVIPVPLTTVQEVASRYGVKLGQLSSVTVSKASTSGRVTQLSFSGANGTQTLAGANAGGFVRSLGAKSSKVTLSLTGSTLTLTGSGSGHGVGLSQWGAKGMAEQGNSDLALLSFYYPGASISLLGAAASQPANLNAAQALGPTLPLAVAARQGFVTPGAFSAESISAESARPESTLIGLPLQASDFVASAFSASDL